jgi:hypothetical protein
VVSVLPGFGIGDGGGDDTAVLFLTENFRLVLVADKRAWLAG